MINTAIRFASTAMLFVAASLWAAAPDVLIKAQSVVGEVSQQHGGKGEWAPLKVGSKLKQADQVRTAVESQVNLEFPDGSQVTIAENSVVNIKTLVAAEGSSNTKLDLKTGKLMFNIHKLASAKSSFEFETHTATAAIRGTEGDVQFVGLRSMASLLSGRLEMSNSQGHATIGPGQMVLQTSHGFVVLPRPKDSKSYQQLVDHYLKDSSEVDSLVKQIQHKLDSLAKVGGLVDSVKPKQDSTKFTCQVGTYPSETSEARMHLVGTAPDSAQVTVGPVKTIASKGQWALDLAWSGTQFGSKVFPVSALLNGSTSDCGVVKFNFVETKVPLILNLATPNPLKVCKGSALLQGTYQGNGARLIAKIGGASVDLSSANGSFSRPVEISDAAHNWDLDQIEFDLSNADNSISQILTLQVDRTCKDVNKIPPAVLVNLQPNLCLAMVDVSSVAGDEVQVSVLADGTEMENFSSNNDVRGHRSILQEGMHSYMVRAIDLAGNKTEQAFSRVTCFPDVRFDIAIDGAAKEVLRVPPPPPGQSSEITRTVSFSVKNLPRDDYGYLKRVTVRMNGHVVQDQRGSQIREVNFATDVTLIRAQSNVVTIEVELQSGRIRTAQKEFDYR